MNNYAIARVFSQIADMQEIQGENFFKIRAYRNAALTMQGLTENLATIAERGELRGIPGVGEAIEAKTREILATGTCALHEELRRRVPEGLLELLHLPGFGAKKVQAAWQQLGIADLDALEAAARAGRLRSLPGMGARSEEKLIEAIVAHRRRRQKTPLPVADAIVDVLAAGLRSTGACLRVDVSGDIRRRLDLVETVELAAAGEPESVKRAFASLPQVVETFAETSESLSARLDSGLRATLFAAPAAAYPELLIRTTGVPEHVAAAGEAGPLIAASADRLAALSTMELEAPWYAARGLAWVPPELRENRGEVEAARQGKLPRLVELGDLRGILHAHSDWSDGASTVEEMALRARALGYEYHGNTDHSQALGVARGLDPVRLQAQMAEIDVLNERLGGRPHVLKGIECDILGDGILDLPLELLAELDVVVASVHTQQRMDADAMTARIVAALSSGVVDVLAHPTGRLLGARDPYPFDFEAVLDAAVEFRVALEINASPDRMDLNDAMARRAKERGLRLTVNSDAHRADHLSQAGYGISQARRAGLEAEDVLNTWPVDRLSAWLRDRSAEE